MVVLQYITLMHEEAFFLARPYIKSRQQQEVTCRHVTITSRSQDHENKNQQQIA